MNDLMSTPETSILVIKPDGVAKGLVKPIRQILCDAGLSIEREMSKTLKPGTVEALYWNIGDIRHRDYFSQLIEFMSSAPVHIFVVRGNEAVNKVRKIIGKRSPASGIRAQWAENIIKNVAHGPNSTARAQREMALLLGGETMKKVFLIGGMSESGKSTLGKYLDVRGIKRLKIVFFLKRVMDREGFEGDFTSWNARNVKERPEWVHRMFTDEFTKWTSEQGTEYCCLESLYGPDLGVYMRKRLGSDKVSIIYVDMDEQTRLERQMIREQLSTLEEAQQLMLPRDQIKREWRVPEIAAVADLSIDNSGSLEDMQRAADAMIERHCPELLVQ